MEKRITHEERKKQKTNNVFSELINKPTSWKEKKFKKIPLSIMIISFLFLFFGITDRIFQIYASFIDFNTFADLIRYKVIILWFLIIFMICWIWLIYHIDIIRKISYFMVIPLLLYILAKAWFILAILSYVTDQIKPLKIEDDSLIYILEWWWILLLILMIIFFNLIHWYQNICQLKIEALEWNAKTHINIRLIFLISSILLIWVYIFNFLNWFNTNKPILFNNNYQEINKQTNLYFKIKENINKYWQELTKISRIHQLIEDNLMFTWDIYDKINKYWSNLKTINTKWFNEMNKHILNELKNNKFQVPINIDPSEEINNEQFNAYYKNIIYLIYYEFYNKNYKIGENYAWLYGNLLNKIINWDSCEQWFSQWFQMYDKYSKHIDLMINFMKIPEQTKQKLMKIKNSIHTDLSKIRKSLLIRKIDDDENMINQIKSKNIEIYTYWPLFLPLWININDLKNYHAKTLKQRISWENIDLEFRFLDIIKANNILKTYYKIIENKSYQQFDKKIENWKNIINN